MTLQSHLPVGYEVVDQTGKPLVLVNEISQGSTAWVYRASAGPGTEVAAKIYYNPKSVEDHLRATVSELEAAGITWVSHQVTVPESLLFDRNEAPVGYSCQFLSVPLSFEVLVGSRPGLPTRLNIAIQLADKVASLHKAGILLGDFNPKNICFVQSSQNSVVLLDTDNWVSEKSGRTPLKYDDQYARPGALAYEGWQTEGYGLGFVLLHLLTGSHPFGREHRETRANSHLERMVLGQSWLLDPGSYRINTSRYPTGHSGVSMLPEPLETVARGLIQDTRVVTADQWSILLKSARAEVIVCAACGGYRFATACCENNCETSVSGHTNAGNVTTQGQLYSLRGYKGQQSSGGYRAGVRQQAASRRAALASTRRAIPKSGDVFSLAGLAPAGERSTAFEAAESTADSPIVRSGSRAVSWVFVILILLAAAAMLGILR